MDVLTFELEDSYEKVLEKINTKYVNNGLRYGWKSASTLSYDQGHWNKVIINNSNRLPYDLSKFSSFKNHKEVSSLWDVIQATIGERALLRVYVNGYTYGTDGYAHRDDTWVKAKYGSDALSETAIVYLNRRWHYDWGGETVIFDDDNEIALSVLPKLGRVFVFNSDLLHAARPLSRICTVLRSIIVFKTFDKKIISPQVNFLADTISDVSHSGSTFFEHLFNTMIILEDRKNNNDVAQAGLYHSIYGTEYFNYKNEKITRNLIRNLIGEYPETLVHEFCNITSRFSTLVNNTNSYSNEMLADLIEIEIANLIEQNYKERYDNSIEQLEDVKRKLIE